MHVVLHTVRIPVCPGYFFDRPTWQKKDPLPWNPLLSRGEEEEEEELFVFIPLSPSYLVKREEEAAATQPFFGLKNNF